MRFLIVEDDFTSRRVLRRLLEEVGESDVAVDGQEALDALELGWQEERPYDVVFLDIMMPRLDGQTALKEIRKREEARGILGSEGVKIIMTTALDDRENIMEAFRSQCEAYLIKPITPKRLFEELRNLGYDLQPNIG